MRQKLPFGIALVGLVAGLVSAYLYRQRVPTRTPVAVTRDPYPSGLYATGIVQSAQASGDDVNVYPQVAGPVTRILVNEGESVTRGAPLLAIDDDLQRRIVDEDVAKIAAARAALAAQAHQLAILERQAALDAGAVSRAAQLSARDAVAVARENLRVVIATRAADATLLAKYVLRAPVAGVVLRDVAAVGSYVSPQGVFDTYSQTIDPVIVMRPQGAQLQVKAYLDEILVPRLPSPPGISATMFIRGTHDVGVALRFVRIQPYVTPKIELSDARLEKVDVRVLPIVFRFTPPKGITLYPGELVDVYIAAPR